MRRTDIVRRIISLHPISHTSIIPSMSGKIDISKLNVPPHKHEFETARFFADRGYDIEFIQPSNIPEVHRPDILMMGIECEIKCPTGKGRNVISRNIKNAAKQSHHIILDLRKMEIPEKSSISEIEKRFKEHKSIKLRQSYRTDTYCDSVKKCGKERI